MQCSATFQVINLRWWVDATEDLASCPPKLSFCLRVWSILRLRYVRHSHQMPFCDFSALLTHLRIKMQSTVQKCSDSQYLNLILGATIVLRLHWICACRHVAHFNRFQQEMYLTRNNPLAEHARRDTAPLSWDDRMTRLICKQVLFHSVLFILWHFFRDLCTGSDQRWSVALSGWRN